MGQIRIREVSIDDLTNMIMGRDPLKPDGPASAGAGAEFDYESFYSRTLRPLLKRIYR